MSGCLKVRRDLLAVRQPQVREAYSRQLLAEFPTVVHEILVDLEAVPEAGGERIVTMSQ
jgi:hypothetical protein